MSARRFVDMVAAAILLAVLSPLFLVIAIANRLTSGRALFRQVRVGRDLQPFVLLKFQTMVDGADAGSSVTVAHDARITPLGRVLRALKLDEVPQLINIIRGDMSLVGPRPLTPNEIDVVSRHLASVVYRVRPGLTGVASLAFADEERLLARAEDPERTYFDEVLPRKIAIELAYVQRRSWATDLVIFLLTPLALFLPSVRKRALIRLVPECRELLNGPPGKPKTVGDRSALGARPQS